MSKWLAVVGTIGSLHGPVSIIAAVQQLGHQQYQEIEGQKEVVYLRSICF